MKNRSTLAAVIITAFLSAVMITSCNHQGPQEATPVISFSQGIKPILAASCAINTDCHVGSSNTNDHIDLTDSMAYSTIISKSLVNTTMPTSSLLYNEVSTGIMPKAPYSKLSATQINTILNWIKEGAKDN